MSADQERRSRLLALKLRALVRDHLALTEDPAGEARVFSPGAAFLSDDAAWFLVDGDATRSLGAVIAWSAANNIDKPLNILCEQNAGIVARRAGFMSADVTVWQVDDRSVVRAEPAPHLPLTTPSVHHMSFAPLIESGGAEIVIEHGVVLGEVRGLEMCRVVDDPFTGESRVEVGLGAHDREAFAMVHGHLPTEDAMRQVISAVLPHRSFEADHHPFNRFGVERLLRWNAMQDPASVGCASLAPAEPPVVRTNVKDAVPCVAIGIDADGNTVAVTFVNGIDLDAVPFALDAADRLGASRAVLAMRSRDITRSTNTLVSLARTPLALVAIQS